MANRMSSTASGTYPIHHNNSCPILLADAIVRYELKGWRFGGWVCRADADGRDVDHAVITRTDWAGTIESRELDQLGNEA